MTAEASATAAAGDEAPVERVVVHLPLAVPVLVRVLRALAGEFPDGRWVDHPEGHLAVEVPLGEQYEPLDLDRWTVAATGALHQAQGLDDGDDTEAWRAAAVALEQVVAEMLELVEGPR